MIFKPIAPRPYGVLLPIVLGYEEIKENDMKTKDLPLNMPCSDPEGCKHFKNAMKYAERIKKLESLIEQLILIAVKSENNDYEQTTIELANQALKGK
jgi:hypothetical protein